MCAITRWCATLAFRPRPSAMAEWGDDPPTGMRRYDKLWRRKAPTACVWDAGDTGRGRALPSGCTRPREGHLETLAPEGPGRQ